MGEAERRGGAAKPFWPVQSFTIPSFAALFELRNLGYLKAQSPAADSPGHTTPT
jgi:hypothetical protein